MIKLGETSLLEFPLRLLALVFPHVRRCYAGFYRNSSAYEHVWTGLVTCLVVAHLMRFNAWIGVILAPVFFMHVVWKEVFHDAPKRVNEEEWRVFWVNLTERASGFVLGIPFVIFSLLRG